MSAGSSSAAQLLGERLRGLRRSCISDRSSPAAGPALRRGGRRSDVRRHRRATPYCARVRRDDVHVVAGRAQRVPGAQFRQARRRGRVSDRRPSVPELEPSSAVSSTPSCCARRSIPNVRSTISCIRFATTRSRHTRTKTCRTSRSSKPCNRHRDMSYSPLAQVSTTLTTKRQPTLVLAGCETVPLDLTSSRTRPICTSRSTRRRPAFVAG